MTRSPQAIACVVSPNAADSELAVRVLGDGGVPARAFQGLATAAHSLDERVGCAVIVEEALLADEIPALREALGRLPPWADLPLIFVARDVGALGVAVAKQFPDSGNVTLLERPLNPHTLVSAVQVALRASARQREVGELLAQREHAVKLRDEFLAMLAHELRNPLAPMRNAVELIRELEVKDPLVLKSIEILDRQVDHVVRLVDDLMDVARLERGKVVLQRRALDVNRAVSAAVESCLPAARGKGHAISAHFADQALPVEADPVRLEQIVCNLVNNAIKFSPAPGAIRVATSAEAGVAVITVQDQGVGFVPGTQDKLFDPFLQVNPSFERTAGGLGIGLTIVKRLAELHGGSVRAESEGPGKGSRFIVQLPLSGRSAAGAAPVKQARAPTPRRRIVVIEDNPDIRESVRLLLTVWGHEVDLASDGPSGLALLLERRPEIALIDVGLPGMNGYDIARAVRKEIADGALRLIAITGYGQPADRELALRAGFNAHLLKPIAPGVLKELLAQAVEKS